MRCFISNSHNPWKNLAIEEYFLRNSTEEIFLLYINDPCIVIGKHQNLYAEINHAFLKNNKIKLARRISGGGTVYQDSQNLNFSFINNCKNLEQISFSKFTLPILHSLIHLGIDASFTERNDIVINGSKVSGNAMHIYKTRVLSHGTLLFNTNLNQLSDSLRNVSSKYTDKSIKSVKSKVTNISNYLNLSKTMEEFTIDIFNYVINNSNSSIPYIKQLSTNEDILIEELAQNKFESWEWIYGYSPRYLFKNHIEISGDFIFFELTIERGIIVNAQILAEINKNPLLNHALKSIINARHDFETIFHLLHNDDITNNTTKFDISEFCNRLF